MAPYAVSITKRITWRGTTEQFSNVYHYDTSSPITTDSGWQSLVDQIVAIEKTIHYNVVTFVTSRVWGPTNAGPAASETRLIYDLSGTGSGSGGRIYAESAVVCQFFLGRASGTGRKRFLRKYYHSQFLPTSAAGSDPTLGIASIAAGDKTPFTTAMNNLKTITVGGSGNDLCTPSGGHLPVGSTPQILDHLHIRQFKQ